MTTGELEGRTAMVTGAASGIGAAAAVAVAAAGARVALVDTADCDETVRGIEQVGGDCTVIKADVSHSADLAAAVDRIVDTYGSLTCAFNNAGIEGVAEREIHEADEDAWDRALDVNLKGVWLSIRSQVPAMLDAGGGSIVNGASVASMVAFDKNASYVASKHAVLGLTKTAALEYADRGIRVNAVCPGVVHTPFIDRFTEGSPEAEQRYLDIIPMGRMAEPREIGAAVVWLLSDAASYVTGHGLVLDGGLVAR